MVKRLLFIITAAMLFLCGCTAAESCQVVATTKPVYEFTNYLCQDTGITVGLLISENVSCLHDYSLQVRQMKMLESADLIVSNGAGLEDFMEDVIPDGKPGIDCAYQVDLLCGDMHTEENTDHHTHHHEYDPHIWLDVTSAKTMAQNIYNGLCERYPQHKETFGDNYMRLLAQLDALHQYGLEQLQDLSCTELITFHDGFAYFAQGFDLHILKAVEEESGSEASAAQLVDLIQCVEENHLPAIFTEVSGSTSAAEIVQAETGCAVYELDMVMSERGYFDAMYHNINTIKEALK